MRLTSCNTEKGSFLEEDEGGAGNRTQVTRKPWKHKGDWQAVGWGQGENVGKECDNVMNWCFPLGFIFLISWYLIFLFHMIDYMCIRSVHIQSHSVCLGRHSYNNSNSNSNSILSNFSCFFYSMSSADLTSILDRLSSWSLENVK